MKTKNILLVIIVFQMFVLAGVFANAFYPLVWGAEIQVKVIPVDPRSMFRGNYALLKYPFSNIKTSQFPQKTLIQPNHIVYTSLLKNAEGIYEFGSVSFDKPKKGLFLKGRLSTRSRGFRARDSHSIRYGIEAYFLPKKKALALEDKLRQGGVASLRVSSSGKAVLVAVH